jgi:broad specificity phosphatase PhoE
MERHITLIRHGQGLNNLDGKDICKLSRDELYDCKLTTKGRKECLDLKSRLKIDFNKIYVSSLERTLQTADILFNDSNCNIKVLDIIREYKNNITAYRRPISQKKDNFGYMDFSEISSDCDNLEPEFDIYGKRLCFFRYKQKNATDFMMDRVKEFLDIIAMSRDEKICVVSHRGFIHMFGRFYDQYIDINNCGVYNMKISM